MKKLRVLMVGNSFSICVGKNLPQMVEAAGGELVLGSAYIGGCTLEEHWSDMVLADKHSDYRPYVFNLWRAGKDVLPGDRSLERAGNVNELLLLEDWDIVTIQQGSHASWDYDTYQPFAQNLMARIHRDAPHARIHIQQTWAYCNGDGRLKYSPFFQENNHWNFDQAGMYARLTAAYCRLARENALPVIPTGYAVQLFRRDSPVKQATLTPSLVYGLVYPEVISQAGEPVGNVYWAKDATTGEQKAAYDTIHLNPIGEYLQGCVWYLSLFGGQADDIVYTPDWLDEGTAAFCRRTAERAVKGFSVENQ